ASLPSQSPASSSPVSAVSSIRSAVVGLCSEALSFPNRAFLLLIAAGVLSIAWQVGSLTSLTAVGSGGWVIGRDVTATVIFTVFDLLMCFTCGDVVIRVASVWTANAL